MMLMLVLLLIEMIVMVVVMRVVVVVVVMRVVMRIHAGGFLVIGADQTIIAIIVTIIVRPDILLVVLKFHRLSSRLG